MPDRPAAPGPEASDAGDAGEPSPTIRVRRGLLALAGVLVAYYAAPVGEVPSKWDIVLAAAGLIAGLGALVFVVVRQVRLMAQFEAGDPSVRLDVLVLVVFVVVPIFSLGYYAIEQGDASQFADLGTKTDALYFSLSTLATVGFGDVHATGQLARALVIVQIVFDLLFVAFVVSVLTTQLRARAADRHAARGTRE
jgi:voltage-gated potassium channel